VFGFGRMTGSINIEEESGLMTVTDGGAVPFTYGQGRGTIVYRSNNLYVEDQDIILEGGAIIREQAVSSVLKGPPNLLIDRDTGTSEIRVYVLLQSIRGTKVGYTGTGSYMISTSLLMEESSTYELGGDTVVITIETEYDGVWQSTVDGLMAEEGLLSPADYSISYDAVTEIFSLTINSVDHLSVKTAFFKVGMT
ncbi:MAG: hypothetical protein U9R75_02795, partial [Candidatus Thermoplasmatota archaeon]|nr:hypothetical protein [Candidatus Thermoplasmatota archaeon]